LGFLLGLATRCRAFKLCRECDTFASDMTY